jgi:hypothetical protein
MKTSELKELALDYVVAGLHGYTPNPATRASAWIAYSTDWAEGGPIIERERISTQTTENHWEADVTTESGAFVRSCGPTPLVAAMRCFVASKLGDDVVVPEELV